VDVELIQDVV